MDSPGVPWCLIFLFFGLSAVSTTISKTTSSANVSQVPSSKEKCHNMYTSNNFYAGPNKKVEALLHEIKKELGEMREEIKCVKENKTAGKGKVNVLPFCFCQHQSMKRKFNILVFIELIIKAQ